MEYMTHVLELMSRAEHANAQRLALPADAPLSPAMFNFQLEDRIQCHTSNCVSYRSDWAGSLCRTMHASKRCCRGDWYRKLGGLGFMHPMHANCVTLRRVVGLLQASVQQLCALLCAQGALQVQGQPNKLCAIVCQCVCAGAV